VHTLLTALAAYVLREKRSTREKAIWKLLVAECVGFLVVLTAFLLLIGEPRNTLELLLLLVYATVGIFVVTVEIPGYLILTRYDETEIEHLTTVREALVKTAYSFGSVGDLKDRVQQNAQTLEDLKLRDLFEEFVQSCERLKNVDQRFWSLALTEISSRVDDVSKRSKHPMPKLIDLLSLAGLSFLIAQFLKLLG